MSYQRPPHTFSKVISGEVVQIGIRSHLTSELQAAAAQEDFSGHVVR